MIHRSLKTWQLKSWQESLQSLISTPEDLLSRLDLGEEWLEPAKTAAKLFPLKVTESFVNRMEVGNPHDPLLLQVLPLHAELENPPNYTKDPLQENDFTPTPGVIHKYRSRVLFVTSSQCAIHCRYCFRRHFPYADNKLNKMQWLDAVDYVRQRPDIHEVILSGGDPLSTSDKQLDWLVDQIASVAHVDTLRIHSRLPIVLPERITTELIQAILHPQLKTVVVVHCNHAQEINTDVTQSLGTLKKSGITLLNQSVLMRNINDNETALTNLSLRLFKADVLPYYLHQLDRVAGASHFEVTDAHAIQLHHQMMAVLPGYLVPKLVRECPNAVSKTPVWAKMSQE